MIDSLSAVELQMKISIHHWRLDLFKFTVISWRQKYASADTFVNALFVNMTIIEEEVERIPVSHTSACKGKGASFQVLALSNHLMGNGSAVLCENSSLFR